MGRFPNNIYFNNYKCLKEYVGFNRITTSNIIIGKMFKLMEEILNQICNWDKL